MKLGFTRVRFSLGGGNATCAWGKWQEAMALF